MRVLLLPLTFAFLTLTACDAPDWFVYTHPLTKSNSSNAFSPAELEGTYALRKGGETKGKAEIRERLGRWGVHARIADVGDGTIEKNRLRLNRLYVFGDGDERRAFAEFNQRVSPLRDRYLLVELIAVGTSLLLEPLEFDTMRAMESDFGFDRINEPEGWFHGPRHIFQIRNKSRDASALIALARKARILTKARDFRIELWPKDEATNTRLRAFVDRHQLPRFAESCDAVLGQFEDRSKLTRSN